VSFSTKDYRKIALTLLSATAPPSENSFDAVNYVRALLLLTYLEYGMAAISQASQLCQEACSLAVSLGWNYLDADKRDEKGASLGSGEALLRRADMRDDSRYPTDMLHHAIRLTWWECWVTDTMIGITCRIRRNLQGVPFKVDIPRAPRLYNEAGCPIIWVGFVSSANSSESLTFSQYFPLRIRALTLLIEAASFPECPDAFYRTKHAEQFATFDTIIENVLLECGLAWADCVKVFAAQDPSHTQALTSAAAQGQEILFMAILMLHA
jgi:Fungal specific transcription factor domain